MFDVRRNTKVAKELKLKDVIHTNSGKKGRIIAIRKGKIEIPGKGISAKAENKPIYDDVFIITFKFIDGLLKDSVYDQTYLSKEHVVWYPEKKRTKYSMLSLVGVAAVALSTGMTLAFVLHDVLVSALSA